MDFMNMLERERLKSKKISKTQSVTSQITNGIDSEDIHIGPSDHVPWLKDRKWAYIRIEGREFGDIPVSMELKLEVWDSPNSAGVVIDAVRCAKLALDRGIGGPLLGPSAYFMKSPPVQYSDDEAHELVEAFIGEDQLTVDVADARCERSRRQRVLARLGARVPTPSPSRSSAATRGRRPHPRHCWPSETSASCLARAVPRAGR